MATLKVTLTDKAQHHRHNGQPAAPGDVIDVSPQEAEFLQGLGYIETPSASEEAPAKPQAAKRGDK